MLIALGAVLLTVLLNWQREECAQAKEAPRQSVTAVMTAQKGHQREATLTDASHLYRICSSRPQRMVSTHGSKPGRIINLCGGFVRRHIVKPLNILYDSRRRLETAPFCLSVSRDYYVIALRHIIR